MAFIYSSTVPLKDTPIVTKVSKPPRNVRLQFKSPALHASLNSIKESHASKPLPDIIIQEKKLIPGRASISKNRTLPYLKYPENDSESKQSEVKVNTLIAECKTISIRKKVKVSIRNIRFQVNSKDEEEKSPDIEIKISNCEDITPVVEDKSENKLLPPRSNFSHSPSVKSNGRRTSQNAASLSPVVSERKPFLNDPYFYLNYLRYANITSFYHILEGGNETNVANFPYFSRVLKRYPKIIQQEKKKITKAPRTYAECTCFKVKNKGIKNMKVFKQSDLVDLVPILQRVFYFPQDVKFTQNIIILNFEGVIGSFNSTLSIKPGILKYIKQLSKNFRIALVVALEWNRCKHVVSFIEDQGIMLSAVYKTIPQGPWSLRLTQDYSQIFKDFFISYPEIQTLIICSHKISDFSQISKSDLISQKTGLNLKLNSERLAIPTQEYPNPPITLILPNYQVREHAIPLKLLLKQISSFDAPEELTQMNFMSILLGHIDNLVRSSAVHQVLLDFLGQVPEPKPPKSGKTRKTSKPVSFCKLHKRLLSADKEEFCQNLFLI